MYKIISLKKLSQSCRAREHCHGQGCSGLSLIISDTWSWPSRRPGRALAAQSNPQFSSFYNPKKSIQYLGALSFFM